MSKIFGKDIIKSFAKSMDMVSINLFCEKIEELLESAFHDLREKRQIIGDEIRFKNLNEYGTELHTACTPLKIALILDAPQVEINTLTAEGKNVKKIWERLKYAWKSTRKKRKKKRTKEAKSTYAEQKYTLPILKVDFARELCQYLPKTTSIVFYPEYLLIKDENLPTQVLVYLAFSGDEDAVKIFSDKKYKLITIDDRNRAINIKDKTESTQRNFLVITRVFLNISYSIEPLYAKHTLIESLIWNVPDALFVAKDLYSCFLQILNYLKFADFNCFRSIYDKDVLLLNDKVINCDISIIKSILKKICKYLG